MRHPAFRLCLFFVNSNDLITPIFLRDFPKRNGLLFPSQKYVLPSFAFSLFPRTWHRSKPQRILFISIAFGIIFRQQEFGREKKGGVFRRLFIPLPHRHSRPPWSVGTCYLTLLYCPRLFKLPHLIYAPVYETE